MKNKIKLFLFIFLLALSFFWSGTGIGVSPLLAASSELEGEVIEQSLKSIPQLSPGEEFDFWVKYKNKGASSWTGSPPYPLSLRTVSQTSSLYYHSSWYNLYTPLRLKAREIVNPGEEIVFHFTLKAPLTPGLHWEKFTLFLGSEKVQGTKIEVPIKVVAQALPPAPPTPPAPPEEGEELYWQLIPSSIEIKTPAEQIAEPQIQVGLFYIEEQDKQELPIEIETLNNSAYEVRGPNNELLVRATQGDKLEVDFDFDIERSFLNNQGTRLLMTDNYLDFIPLEEESVFQITSWSNGPFWGMNVNDNRFAGKLRVQYNPSTQRLWLINELPLEEYLLGVQEVSDSWPFEFLKAQAIAARTYAYYRKIDPKYTNTPSNEPLFTLQATQADQVYRGLGGKERNPNFGRAVKETRGIIATYNNDPILAYYFAQSDGRTRSSHEVYMTKEPVPYLKGKIDPPGKGKEMKGHGVGLPQYSGYQAAKEGANFSQILKYYYTDIDLTKLY